MISTPNALPAASSGMGDIVGLVEKAAETIDQEEAEKLARKMMKGKFDLEDYAGQLRQITKMGSLSGILGMLPGVGKIKAQIEDANLDTTILKRQAAIICSMTTQGAAARPTSQGEPQEAHRRRVRHHGAGGQPAAEAVRRHVHDDEAHEQARAEGADAPRPVRADAEGHGGQPNRPTLLNGETDTDGPEDPPGARRGEEASLLPHRGRRQPQPARRALHREARQLQPDAAGRTCAIACACWPSACSTG